jgi:hypothetical protein
VKQKRRGRPKGRVPGSLRSKAESAKRGGLKHVSATTLWRLERHAAMVERYPFMETWSRKLVLEVAAGHLGRLTAAQLRKHLAAVRVEARVAKKKGTKKAKGRRNR